MAYLRSEDKYWNFQDVDTKQYTHCYHNYPAMMIPQVAREIISRFKPDSGCKRLFDPYMGSGTSLVEASLADMDSVGTDLNPLARLMARVKTAKYDVAQIKSEFQCIQNGFVFYADEAVRDRNFDRISNHEYWYSERVLLGLSYIYQLIEDNSKNKDFFYVALSEVVREASYTRNGEFKRFRMEPDKIEAYNPDVFKMFEIKVNRNITGLEEYVAAVPDKNVLICDFDSTLPIPSDIIEKESIDMVLTSPPYGDSRTTVAYGQFSRWANEWFLFENAKNLDTLLMGGKKSEDKRFSSRSITDELARIHDEDERRYMEVVSFLNDYSASIYNVAATVRKGGVACYVVGNRNVKGVRIPLDYFTAEMFEQCGFNHVTTLVRCIPNKRMPSKTSPTNIAGKKVDTMNNEYIVVMKK